MVNKYLVNLVIDLGTKAGKSFIHAYQRVISSKHFSICLSCLTNSSFIGSGAQQSGFGKAAQNTIGRFIHKPMTKEEALQILNIEEEKEKEKEVDPKKVMERFEALFEKNNTEKGGSFYIQSKIYFAKEHLMMDFPPELNSSKFNPSPAEKEDIKKEQDQSKDE